MIRKTSFRASLLCLLMLAAAGAPAQSAKIQINLDHLAKHAVESVNITLDKQLLEFAAKLFPDNDPEAARIKKLIRGLQGVYVRSFEFDKEGAYSLADLDGLRNQLSAPGWKRIVEVRNKRDGESVDVCLRLEGESILGLVVIAAEPKELTVVNIAGPMALEELRMLEGHLGIPKLPRLDQKRGSEQKPKVEIEKPKKDD